MDTSADERIRRLADTQHGVVTRAQLLDAGLTRRQIERRLESGHLRPVHRGVYLLGVLRGSLRPPRAREMAAVLACGPHAVLSHRSAALIWGLMPRPGRRVEITVPSHVRRDRPGLRIYRARALRPTDRAVRDGIPVTAPARTLRDLSVIVGTDTLTRVLDRAERATLIRHDELASLVAGHAGRPGAPLLRAVAGFEGGEVDSRGRPFTRSEAERRFLQLVRSAGLPEPETNVVVLGHEVDVLWRERRLVVEVDGFRYHGSPPAFENDRRRDARLVSGGYRVMRAELASDRGRAAPHPRRPDAGSRARLRTCPIQRGAGASAEQRSGRAGASQT